MQKFTFKRNWCEYLTPCPFMSGTMIGEYDCVKNCPHSKNSKENKCPEREPGDYRRYFDVWTGEVECSYPKY